MVRVIGPRDPRDKTAINTTSISKDWSRGLSPMILGPVPVPGRGLATNVENAWQYSKVYKQHMAPNGDPNAAWYFWSRMGFNKPYGVRYPMGKGVEPEYSFWNGQKFGYLDARKNIYMPIYAAALKQSAAYQKLLTIYQTQGTVTLWDVDGYDYLKMRRTLEDCVDDPNKILGHAFCIALCLEGRL